MDLSLTTSDGTSVYASVPKQNNGKVTIKTGEFTITTEQVVTWTATATGQHAPAVSWLAVERTGDVETPDTLMRTKTSAKRWRMTNLSPSATAPP